jgi:hypothetical protein
MVIWKNLSRESKRVIVNVLNVLTIMVFCVWVYGRIYGEPKISAFLPASLGVVAAVLNKSIDKEDSG